MHYASLVKNVMNRETLWLHVQNFFCYFFFNFKDEAAKATLELYLNKSGHSQSNANQTGLSNLKLLITEHNL